MRYGEIKRKVLELLDRFTVAGAEVSPAYNGQSDLLRRIPGLVNDGVVRIREQVPLRGETSLDGGTKDGAWSRYALPEDLRRVLGVWKKETPLASWGDWRLAGREILLPPGAYTVEYAKVPPLLPQDPEEDYEYEEEVHVLTAAAYYAAAMAVMGEDTTAYTVLLREFNARLEGMGEKWSRRKQVEDVYGFQGVMG